MKNEKINLHTHSTFCDGKNSPEEMILSAISKGFTVLGFSGHTMFPFASDWHIAPRDHENYVKTIRTLAEKYSDKIEILCGFEADYIPCFCMPEKKHFGDLNPDYLIGAVHYVVANGGQFTVDESIDGIRAGIKNVYNGNGKQCVLDYFAAQREMLKKGDFEIWAHPDLVRKRNNVINFFDENEDWYKEELKATVTVASKAGVIAEINTGAIARGAMDDVYPSAYFLELLHEAGIPICINSDCHNAPDLDCAFDRAMDIARKTGYPELTYPVKNRLVHIKL